MLLQIFLQIKLDECDCAPKTNDSIHHFTEATNL